MVGWHHAPSRRALASRIKTLSSDGLRLRVRRSLSQVLAQSVRPYGVNCSRVPTRFQCVRRVAARQVAPQVPRPCFNRLSGQTQPNPTQPNPIQSNPNELQHVAQTGATSSSPPPVLRCHRRIHQFCNPLRASLLGSWSMSPYQAVVLGCW
jgi:hypothetical protein